MKITIMIVLLLSVTLNVVHAIRCYDCVAACENPKEIECPNADGCLSVTMTPDSKYQSLKTCVDSDDSEGLCNTVEDKDGKCYVCDTDLCNKKDEP